MKLEGKVALITGGGTGIGTAIAERFVQDGAWVCITGRRQEVLDRAAAKFPKGKVITCAGDVANYEDAQRMVAAAVSISGKLDILVNNAGLDTAGSIIEIDPDLWRRIIETNLTGPLLVMKAALPHMVKAKAGSVINIASLAGIRCIPAMAAYCSSKAGLIMLTQQAALDYGPSGVRCNAVCPGAIRTEMLENSMSPLKEILHKDMDGVFTYFSSNSPLRRVAAPREISGLCSYLASDESSFMTGSVLVIDGGAAIVDVNGTTVSNAGMNWGNAK